MVSEEIVVGFVVGVILGGIAGLSTSLFKLMIIKKNSVNTILRQKEKYRIEGRKIDFKGDIHRSLKEEKLKLIERNKLKEMEEIKRNTAKEKEKENKKYPYLKGKLKFFKKKNNTQLSEGDDQPKRGEGVSSDPSDLPSSSNNKEEKNGFK